MLECLQVLFLNKVHQLCPVDIHGEDGEKEECLKIEVSEKSHHSKKTKILDRAVKNSKEEPKCEDSDFRE